MASTSNSSDGAKAAADESLPKIPNLKLPELYFFLTSDYTIPLREVPLTGRAEKEQKEQELIKGIEEDEMAPYLSTLIHPPSTTPQSPSPSSPMSPTIPLPDSSHGFSPSSLPQLESLLVRLKEKNEEQLKSFDQKLDDAEKNLGETEVGEILRNRAAYLAKIGEKEVALAAYEKALEKTAGLGSKIDIRLAMMRVGFFHGDNDVIVSNCKAAKALVESGGDWDRKNRLKAYEGLYLISIRNFKQGGSLILDTIATFTANELIDYDDFLVLCVIAGVLILGRKDYKKTIIDSPEIIQVLPSRPVLENYVRSLYDTDYHKFFRALVDIEEECLIPSRILSIHSRYYMREMRIKAYSQLLESYKSVTIANLCDAFGITQEMLEADLSRFIAAGRLNCSIDKVAGIVETNRTDIKNSKYEAVVRHGDLVLNNIQKLSRAIAV
ncbi:proteasome 26S subunit [Atractiella rhizophila]|nr:proteasome 26S subunit [Atractiella rhizophila]